MKPEQMLSLLGGRIRALRKEKNLSQEKIAELAGLHPTYISDIERGKVNASITTYFMVSSALGTTLTDLVAGIADDGEALEEEMVLLLTKIRSLDTRKRKPSFRTSHPSSLLWIRRCSRLDFQRSWFDTLPDVEAQLLPNNDLVHANPVKR